MSNQDLNKEIVSFMQEMRTNFSEVKAELGEIKTDVAGLKTDVAGLKTDVAGLKNDVTVLKADAAELKNDIAVLKVDVSELKEDVAELKGKVDKLEADVAGNKKDIASLYVLNEKLSDSLEEFKAYTYQQFEYVRHDIHLLTVSHNQLADKVRLNTEAIDDMLADMQLMRSEHESIKYQIKKTQREASSRIADVSHFAYSLDEKISILADEIKPDKH
ncbi:MAG: hypothetical protein PUG78_07265 [Eubacteriales bacterium]|nr:hypothetical protein [Eubacteriales bacterium]